MPVPELAQTRGQQMDQPDTYATTFRQWALLKAQHELTEKRLNHLRDSLMDNIVRDGESDEKGNTHFLFKAPIDVAGKRFEGIKREARTSTTLNEERAIALVKAKGLGEQVIVHVESINIDALYEAYAHRKISEDEIESLFDTKTSHAFKPVIR